MATLRQNRLIVVLTFMVIVSCSSAFALVGHVYLPPPTPTYSPDLSVYNNPAECPFVWHEETQRCRYRGEIAYEKSNALHASSTVAAMTASPTLTEAKKHGCASLWDPGRQKCSTMAEMYPNRNPFGYMVPTLDFQKTLTAFPVPSY